MSFARAFIRIVLVAVFFFATGVFFGVYYHIELMVWWRTLGLGEEAQIEEVKETSSAVSASESHLNLMGVAEQLPLVYSDTLVEERIQEYLKQGAVVLPLGTSFGEPGNVVVTAHSSGTEAFGPYRFAFAELAELEEGDTYEISTPTATYTYRVYDKEIVWPHEVDKLPRDERSTVTLVTCWPLWTNFQRLLVHTELIEAEYTY